MAEQLITPHRIALGIEYDGSAFSGWQSQLNPHLRTVQETLEQMSVASTLAALKEAEVVVLVLDALLGMDEQDLRIARLAEREGRALVIALNKWDAVEDRNAARRRVEDALMTSLAQSKGVTVVPLSAATGRGVDKLMPAVRATCAFYGARVSSFRPGGGAPTLAVLPQIPGHLLCVCGDQDPLMPLQEQQAIAAALSADRVARQEQLRPPLERRMVVASGAGHGFLCEARSDYNAEAAALGWHEMLELFAKAL